MFLVVFVSLAVSILGLYAQVLSLQTARMYNSENTLMQTMLNWHNSAVQLVHNNTTVFTPTSFTTTGCVLTPNLDTSGTGLTFCGASLGSTSLPAGYNTANYSFSSLTYQPSSSPPYVVTYATPDSTGYLHVPTLTSPSIGYTASDLLAQLKRAAPVGTVFGTVTGNAVTQYYSAVTGTAGTPMSYPVPTSVPANSVALVSIAN